MMTMTEEELDIYELKQQLYTLKIEVKYAEKWIDNAKETIEHMQNIIFKLEAKDV